MEENTLLFSQKRLFKVNLENHLLRSLSEDLHTQASYQRPGTVSRGVRFWKYLSLKTRPASPYRYNWEGLFNLFSKTAVLTDSFFSCVSGGLLALLFFISNANVNYVCSTWKNARGYYCQQKIVKVFRGAPGEICTSAELLKVFPGDPQTIYMFACSQGSKNVDFLGVFEDRVEKHYSNRCRIITVLLIFAL